MRDTKQAICLHWMTLLFKAYIMALPIVWFFMSRIDVSNQPASRFEQKIITSEMSDIITYAEAGYLIAAGGLLLLAIIAARNGNKAEARGAFVFAILGIASLITLCLNTFFSPIKI